MCGYLLVAIATPGAMCLLSDFIKRSANVYSAEKVEVPNQNSNSLTAKRAEIFKGREFKGQGILDLSKTSVTDEDLQSLTSLKGLKVLKLNDTEITDEGLKHLFNLESLQALDLGGTKITDAG